MANFLRWKLAVALCALLLLVAARGSENAAIDKEEQPKSSGPIKVEVNLVNILCTVTDKDNRFVTGLQKEDFKVFEDGTPQEISNFSRETNLPLAIALLIDTSESVMPKLKFEQQVAINFLHSVLRHEDKALLVEFDSGVTLLQDFTNDVNKLAREIRALRAGGGTSLYDAVYLVSEQKLLAEKGRKTIILITDGSDTTSRTSFEEALEMAQRAEVTVFAISTNKILERFAAAGPASFALLSQSGRFIQIKAKDGDKALQKLAEETGGRVFYPQKTSELDLAFKQINEELRSQYYLGYFSSNQRRDGAYRTITVKVAGKDLRVRHRRGYYAPGG